MGIVSNNETTKSIHSLYFFFCEKINAVNTITATFAISEGWICTPPITSHLCTPFITGPNINTAISRAIVIPYITNCTCQVLRYERSM